LIIIDSAFLGDVEMGYYRMMNDPDYKTPLSGSALHCLMDRDMNASFNRQKNDTYAAGITLLSALFNEDYERYYDYNSYRIKQEVIAGRINL